MADAVSPKRVLPARERRESAAKRHASSPAPTPKSATPKKAASAKSTPKSSLRQKQSTKKAPIEQSSVRRPSTPIVEETLPTKITEAKPLPTTRQPQPAYLSLEDYRSVAESAVLAASLHRSRIKWLCDGLFERYWTKPSKKKGAPEISANNPDQKSMQKLGICTVTVEPHTFDAVIYTVRDPQAIPPVHYRHPNQYPQQPPPQHYYYPAGPAPPPQQNIQARPQQPPLQALPPPTSPGMKQEDGAASGQPTPTAPKAAFVDRTSPPSPNNVKVKPPPSPSPSIQSSAAPPTAQKPNADPVIQMLATRAAADPELKNLMKVVASSKASQEQLKLFQGHIDELNGIIKRQEAEQAQRAQNQAPQNGPPIPNQTPPNPEGSRELAGPSRTNTPIQPAAPHDTPHPNPYPPPGYHPNAHLPPPVTIRGGGNGKAGPLGPHLPPPPYPQYAPPPPRPEPRIKSIVVEFTTPASGTQPASQDRWLFPEYAVLDTPLSGRGLEMVCSFFVVRKGSQIQNGNDDDDDAPSKWKADEEYFQPVTMTLRAPLHRTLETIARAAKPLPEVQAHMKQVMEFKRRAPTEFLAWRLPRGDRPTAATAPAAVMDIGANEVVAMQDSGGGEFVDSGVEMVGTEMEEDDELKDFYGI